MPSAAPPRPADVTSSTLPPIAPTLGSIQLPDQQQQQQQSSAEPTNRHPPTIPPIIKLASRRILTAKRPRSWAWKPFSSSARRDDARFSHWVRSAAEYADYPYARFDVHLDRLTIRDDDWASLEEDWRTVDAETAVPKSGVVGGAPIRPLPQWTRQETEELLSMVHRYELRWPVIVDRWHGRFQDHTFQARRTVEDLQHRYYHVGNVLARKRLEGVLAENPVVAAGRDGTVGGTGVVEPHSNPIDDKTALATLGKHHATHPSLVPNISIPASGTALNSKPFDLLAERARRARLDYYWNRPKEQEREEEGLRAELRLVESQLRKLKKSGRHLVPKGSVHGVSANASKTTAERKAELDAYVSSVDNLTASFTATAPVPTPGTPYLQSGRLFPPALGGGLNKSTLKQMEDILAELSVKEPIATKRACDLYDEVRKAALTLLILQKIVLRKEAEVMGKREKLVDVLGVNGTTTAAVETKSETKKRKKCDAKPALTQSSGVAGAVVGGAKKAKSSSTGGTPPSSDGPSKKKKAKKTTSSNTPLTVATNASVSSTGVVNPLNIGSATSVVPPTSHVAKPTESASTKTNKKRGRPSIVKKPLAVAPMVVSSDTPLPTADDGTKRANMSSSN